MAEGEPEGVRLTFRPDPEIFTGVTRFDAGQVRRRLEEIAFLHAGVMLELRAEGQVWKFHAPDGLSSLVAARCEGRAVVLPLVAHFVVSGESERGAPIWAQVALQWVEGGEGARLGFVNGERLVGGTPFMGASAGVLRGVRAAAESLGLLPRDRSWRRLAAGVSERMVVAVSVGHPEPLYGARTREVMLNKDAGSMLRRGLAAQVRVLLQDHPEALRSLLRPPAPAR